MHHKDQASLSNGNQYELVAQAVVFLSNRPEDLATLLAATGVDPADLRARMSDPAFATGLLDYLTGNEPLLLAFCEETGHDPQKISRLAAYQGGWG